MKKGKIGKKTRIITCFGNRIRSGTFLIFFLNWTRITDIFMNVFNGVLSPCAFS